MDRIENINVEDGKPILSSFWKRDIRNLVEWTSQCVA